MVSGFWIRRSDRIFFASSSTVPLKRIRSVRRKSGIFSPNRSKALRLPRRLPPRAQISIKLTGSRVSAHRRCVRMWHPLPKNVHSLRLVSTLAITTHPPICCERSRKACRRQARHWQRAKRSPAGLRHRDSDYGAQAAGLLLALCQWRACRRQALRNRSQHLGG